MKRGTPLRRSAPARRLPERFPGVKLVSTTRGSHRYQIDLGSGMLQEFLIWPYEPTIEWATAFANAIGFSLWHMLDRE